MFLLSDSGNGIMFYPLRLIFILPISSIVVPIIDSVHSYWIVGQL